tara:strand:- start:285 stop:494 length:210 start_codon:yes stop_codon:yes gene_type:complete
MNPARDNFLTNISQLWLAGEGEYMIVTTAIEAGIDNAIASKQQDGYTYSGNKHYNEGNEYWVANFSKEN